MPMIGFELPATVAVVVAYRLAVVYLSLRNTDPKDRAEILDALAHVFGGWFRR
jgi:hypothetical protein